MKIFYILLFSIFFICACKNSAKRHVGKYIYLDENEVVHTNEHCTEIKTAIIRIKTNDFAKKMTDKRFCSRCVNDAVYDSILNISESVKIAELTGDSIAITSKISSLWQALKQDGGDVGTEEEFSKWFLAPGKKGFENRKKVYDAFKADGADIGESYGEFSRWLGLHAVNPKQPVSHSSVNPAVKKRYLRGLYDNLKALEKEENLDFGMGKYTYDQFKEKYGTKKKLSGLYDALSDISDETNLDFGIGSKDEFLGSFTYHEMNESKQQPSVNPAAKKRYLKGLYDNLKSLQDDFDIGMDKYSYDQFKAKYGTKKGIEEVYDKLSSLSDETNLDFGIGSKDEWMKSFTYYKPTLKAKNKITKKEVVKQKNLFGQWLQQEEKYINPALNLQWDLSGYGEWYVVGKEKMPKNMIFCASLKETYITISISAQAEEYTPINAWDGAQQYINGFIAETINRSFSYPGIKKGKIKYEKCYFLYKKAIKWNLPVEVNDVRTGTDESVGFIFTGYVYVMDNIIIQIIVMYPKAYIRETGVDFSKTLFQDISYYKMK